MRNNETIFISVNIAALYNTCVSGYCWIHIDSYNYNACDNRIHLKASGISLQLTPRYVRMCFYSFRISLCMSVCLFIASTTNTLQSAAALTNSGAVASSGLVSGRSHIAALPSPVSVYKLARFRQQLIRVRAEIVTLSLYQIGG